MDAINELIKRETEKVLYGSTCIFSTPCRVIQRVNDELFEVETIANHTRYTVYNYSGSNIQENENVMLYYKGRVLSNQSAYIGAVLNKSTINYITGKNRFIFNEGLDIDEQLEELELLLTKRKDELTKKTR